MQPFFFPSRLCAMLALLPLLMLGSSNKASAQSFSDLRLRDMLRNRQVLGMYGNGLSYSVNPNQVLVQHLDSALGDSDSTHRRLTYTSAKTGITVGLMPLVVTQQYNSQLPYEWNDGALVPAKGYQALLSAGVYARIGKHISIQFMPEWVYADNKIFDHFPQQLTTREWARYYRFLNTSDIPEQMGEGEYRRFFPGQSSIRYNFRSYSVGISSENLWWGPGWRNSLVMSNNAPGFVHLTFNTTRPVQTGIGTFEGQVIAGKLNESGVLPPRIYSVDENGNFVYSPKRQEWRYITGMVLTWQPKWVRNLYLGISKASYLYHSDISNPLDVLPLQGFFGRTRTAAERSGKKSSMGSLFARFVMPSEKAEIYMEFGRKDISLMPWNILQVEDYRRAYVTGIRKLFPVKNDAHIQLGVELTQMQAPTAELIRDPDSWYTDRYVRQGYTNMGQVLGAGIGPGSNSQTLEVNWVKGLKRIGLRFERLRHNSDFYYYAFEYYSDFRRHWVDISTTLQADWNFGSLVLSGQLAIVRSYNYKWLIVQVNPISGTNYFVPGNEYLNIGGKISATYRF